MKELLILLCVAVPFLLTAQDNLQKIKTDYHEKLKEIQLSRKTGFLGTEGMKMLRRQKRAERLFNELNDFAPYWKRHHKDYGSTRENPQKFLAAYMVYASKEGRMSTLFKGQKALFGAIDVEARLKRAENSIKKEIDCCGLVSATNKAVAVYLDGNSYLDKEKLKEFEDITLRLINIY